MSRGAIGLAALALALALAPTASARRDRQLAGDALRAARLLGEAQVAPARPLIAALMARAPDEPESRWLAAQLAFRDGDYALAVDRLAGLPDDDLGGEVGLARALATRALEVTRGFIAQASPSGRFVIWHAPGLDAAIAPLAGEALDAAAAAIGADLGHTPAGPIRVELLGSPQDLAKLSTLTTAEIEATGTIALSKYGRLMLVSPRATLFGYPWLDTLAHEYMHLVVSELGREQVPVWLQEGLARFAQRRWRAPVSVDATTLLSASERSLLAGAVRRDRLIDFDAMHPSMAKLPSQEAAALAYAQVVTFVAYLHQQVGYAGLRDLVTRQASGTSAQRAVAEVMGQPFVEVERAWRASLRGVPAAMAAAPPIRFARGGRDADAAGLDQISNPRARKHARLGGMLRARGHAAAAVLEYERALAAGPDDARVAGKLARALVEAGDLARAIEIAQPLAAADEDDPVAAVTLGAAHLARRAYAPAAAALEQALRVSPFDPAVRCGLATAYAALAHAAASRERAACATVSASP